MQVAQVMLILYAGVRLVNTIMCYLNLLDVLDFCTYFANPNQILHGVDTYIRGNLQPVMACLTLSVQTGCACAKQIFQDMRGFRKFHRGSFF